MICYCTFDEMMEGHRCHCPDHAFCGEPECDKNPDVCSTCEGSQGEMVNGEWRECHCQLIGGDE